MTTLVKKKKASNFTTRTFDPGMFENRMTSTLHSTLIIQQNTVLMKHAPTQQNFP